MVPLVWCAHLERAVGRGLIPRPHRGPHREVESDGFTCLGSRNTGRKARDQGHRLQYPVLIAQGSLLCACCLELCLAHNRCSLNTCFERKRGEEEKGVEGKREER